MRKAIGYVKGNGKSTGKRNRKGDYKGALRAPSHVQKLMVMAAYGPDMS
jgi:hypothetical protein